MCSRTWFLFLPFWHNGCHLDRIIVFFLKKSFSLCIELPNCLHRCKYIMAVCTDICSGNSMYAAQFCWLSYAMISSLFSAEDIGEKRGRDEATFKDKVPVVQGHCQKKHSQPFKVLYCLQMQPSCLALVDMTLDITIQYVGKYHLLLIVITRCKKISIHWSIAIFHLDTVSIFYNN